MYFEPPNTYINQYRALRIPRLEPPGQVKVRSVSEIYAIRLRRACSAGICSSYLSGRANSTDMITSQVRSFSAGDPDTNCCRRTKINSVYILNLFVNKYLNSPDTVLPFYDFGIFVCDTMMKVSNNRISRALYPITLAIISKIKDIFKRIISSENIGGVSIQSISLTGTALLSVQPEGLILLRNPL